MLGVLVLRNSPEAMPYQRTRLDECRHILRGMRATLVRKGLTLVSRGSLHRGVSRGMRGAVTLRCHGHDLSSQVWMRLKSSTTRMMP
jgi:hypothetical protein